jgi:hypothetical protein
MAIVNRETAGYDFLAVLYKDDYFPDHVLDKGRMILIRLCERLDADGPADLEALHALTNAPTEELNALEPEFEAAGSEIETVTREEICGDVHAIAMTYGFSDADHEEPTHGRNLRDSVAHCDDVILFQRGDAEWMETSDTG